jgi:hypothetical protein
VERRYSSDDLPQPDFPIMVINSPLLTLRGYPSIPGRVPAQKNIYSDDRPLI